MVNKKYEIFKEPYIRKADYKYYGTKNIMIDFIISLLPIILAGWYQNGVKIFINNNNYLTLFYPLIFVILGGLFTFSIEAIYFYFFNRDNKELNCFEKSLNSYSIIPGLLLSIILPLNTPIWVLLIGCIFTTIFGKIVFGGFGHNIFNPALVGYIFIMTAFYGVINNTSSDIVTSSTPLQELNNILFHNKTIDEIISNNGGIVNVCFGLKSGTIGETSSIACFVSLLYLYIRKVIDIKTPLIVLLTFFITSILIASFININIINFSLFNLFNGGIIFGAIFMATEPVTSPRSYYGKIIYAFFIGLIALFLRLLSDLRDGTSTAILFMNSLTIIIDLLGAKLRAENNIVKKLSKIFVITIIYLSITSYSVLKLNSYKKSNNNEQDIKIEIKTIMQEYSKINEQKIEFIYQIELDDNEYEISSDINGNILSDLSMFSIEEQDKIKAEIVKNKINKRSLNKEKHYGYIINVEIIEDNNFNITSYARGYFDNVIITINYNNGNISKVEVDLSKETELSGGLANSTGSKKDLIEIGEGKRTDIVSGVTYTSVSLLSARKAINDYINYLNGGINE